VPFTLVRSGAAIKHVFERRVALPAHWGPCVDRTGVLLSHTCSIRTQVRSVAPKVSVPAG